MIKQLIRALALGSIMIVGISSCGTKSDIRTTSQSTEQSSIVYEKESTSEVQTESTDMIESTDITMEDTVLSGCNSVEELVKTYIEAIEKADWDIVVSLTMFLEMDSNTDGLYDAYINEGRTDLVGTAYNWSNDYELTYEAIDKEIDVMQETKKFIQTCQAKVMVMSPVFYPEESDYYDSVLLLSMIQDENERWYLTSVELQGQVKEYDDMSEWSEIASYQSEWLPVLTQFIEREDSGVKEWDIDNAYAETDANVKSTATYFGMNISYIFHFDIKLNMENDTVQYQTISVMCVDGQWSILN